ncbi:hypothetical protein F5Y18DRAFT_417874 [Xylariaceae sp. FL1019]|nr:hypothetical protein F5Y18DRAFT_417874 [Xylariaceae sp. FL1019]
MASLILLESISRETSENALSKRYISQYQPFPLPEVDERRYDSRSVSIIVPTIDWGETFPTAILSWLATAPRELIIVTSAREEAAARAVVDSEPIQDAATTAKTPIQILTIAEPNKREQLIIGINASSGEVLALVDDDTYWPANNVFISQVTAPFHDNDIALVGTPVESYVPTERQHPDVITPYEVAALRSRSRRRGGNKAFFAADGSTNFTVSGATMFLRADVLRDPEFQREFTEETFMGVRLHTGDDSFITKWVLFQHVMRAPREDGEPHRRLKLYMQLLPETTVLTGVATDSKYIRQMQRWLRTGLRFRLACLFMNPGLRSFRRESPYMCRKMYEGLANPVLNLLWYAAFFNTLQTQPLLAFLMASWYLYGMVTGIQGFLREFPYCRHHIWAIVLADKVSLISDFHCFLTLGIETWNSRQSVK